MLSGSVVVLQYSVVSVPAMSGQVVVGFSSLLSVSHPSSWEVGLTSSVGQGERI